MAAINLTLLSFSLSFFFSASLFYFLPNYNLLEISGSSGSDLLTNFLCFLNTTTTPRTTVDPSHSPFHTIPAGYSPIYYLGIFFFFKKKNKIKRTSCFFLLRLYTFLSQTSGTPIIAALAVPPKPTQSYRQQCLARCTTTKCMQQPHDAILSQLLLPHRPWCRGTAESAARV